MSYYAVTYSNSLSHHGIKGQKWGIRRYQNDDGTLTAEGRRRYGSAEGHARRAYAKVFEVNEKTYRKLGNKTLASMNKQAKNDQLKRANEADKKKLEKYNKDGSRKYSKEVQKKLNRNKAPMNAAEKALNVASLGMYQSVKNSEMRYKGQSEKRQHSVSGVGLLGRGVVRGLTSRNQRWVVQGTKLMAAYGEAAIYELSGRNPAVKTGVMIAGRALNAAGNLSIAMLDTYNVYAQARDTVHYIDNKRKEK